MNNDSEQNLIEKIIESKVTWIVFIIAGVMAAVNTIIIPLNDIKNAQANIQITLNEIKAINANFDQRITDNSNSIIIIQEELKNLQKSKHE